MSTVLLTHSNHLYSDRKQMEKMQPYPPLQTILAAAFLREHGIDTSVFDPMFRPPREGFEASLANLGPGLVVVCEDDFNFLSKMCLGHSRQLAFWMAATARLNNVRAVVHGSDASDHVDDYLKAGFAAVLLGEVETTLLELCRGKALGDIAGLAYRAHGVTRYNSPRPLADNLDAFPMPAWDLVDIEAYRQAWNSAHGYFSLNIASSRGCPYRCNWCAKPIFGHSYHSRSPRSVAAEMMEVKSRFRPDHIWFADDIFALPPKWTVEFADAVEESGAQLPFKMQSRCDLMTRESVASLRRAGCVEVWMGAESGSQRVLDAMDKGLRVHDIYAARENLRRHGIRACFFLQFGYPGEHWSDIELTIAMVRDTEPDDIGVSVSYPLPGTKFHQIVMGQLGTRTNWSESGDLSMMFCGTYSTEFYRLLADALHSEVRGGGDLERAWERVHALREMETGAGAAA